MSERRTSRTPLYVRLVVAALVAVLLAGLADSALTARAQQPAGKKAADEPKKKSDDAKKAPDTKKKAADAKVENPDEQDKTTIPPPIQLSGVQWLLLPEADRFDRLWIVGEFGSGDPTPVDVQGLAERPLSLKLTTEASKDKIEFTLAKGDARLFQVPRARIKKVEHFEDLVMEEATKQMRAGQFDLAFELLSLVVKLGPNWPGLGEKLVEFWYTEAGLKAVGQEEQVLGRLHQLREYCRANGVTEHEDARGMIGRAVDRLIDAAFKQKNYQRARHFLYILEHDYPDHPVVVGGTVEGGNVHEGWQRRLRNAAEELVRQAKQKEEAGQDRAASLLMLEAADLWPRLPGIRDHFDRVFRKYPILHAGVAELPSNFVPWAPPGTADARVAHLLHVPLMEVSGVGENTQFSSRVMDYELTEGGRRFILRIKPRLRWSDGEKPITAMDVARSISVRCDPSLSSYDAALKSVLDKVAVPEVNEVAVDLKRNQLRPQANFLFNLAPGHRLVGDRFAGGVPVGAGPFRVVPQPARSDVVMQANEHYFGGRPKISEFVERRYAKGRDRVNALLAGDVSLVDRVPANDLIRVHAAKDLSIVTGRVPALHVIAFDFRTRFEFQSRTLRRAMAYAIDRQRVLEEAILRIPNAKQLASERETLRKSMEELNAKKGELTPEEYEIKVRPLRASAERLDLADRLLEENVLANGPFPEGSYAFEEGLEPWYYDAVMGKGLADAAKKELKVNQLRFRLHYPDVEEARDACTFLQAYWKIIGVEVELFAVEPHVLEEQVALGRRFELVYRIHYVRDPVLDAARVLCLGQPVSPSGQAMPNAASPWLRQSLGELELTTDWKLATEKLRLLQHWGRKDVAVIPLWQLKDYHAYHKRLSGLVDDSLALYQEAEKWQIDPWFREYPE